MELFLLCLFKRPSKCRTEVSRTVCQQMFVNSVGFFLLTDLNGDECMWCRPILLVNIPQIALSFWAGLTKAEEDAASMGLRMNSKATLRVKIDQ